MDIKECLNELKIWMEKYQVYFTMSEPLVDFTIKSSTLLEYEITATSSTSSNGYRADVQAIKTETILAD